ACAVARTHMPSFAITPAGWHTGVAVAAVPESTLQRYDTPLHWDSLRGMRVRHCPGLSFSTCYRARPMRPLALSVAALLATIPPVHAQSGAAPSTPQREAARLDGEGKTAEARVIFQRLIEEASDPAAKANAQRAMAMSYAFDGDCTNAVKYEEMAIAYWATREQAEPQNAFFQEGELANEVARVCIDAGDFATAERWYRKGCELGRKEPEPRTHAKSLWDFRLAHALGRLAARRGDKPEAARQVAVARKLLDADSALARQQARFFPY